MSARRHLLALTALALLAGCVIPLSGERTGRSLHWGRAAIAPGKTTKLALFQALGPPMAIAGRGEYVMVPATTVHHVDGARARALWQGGGSYVQQGDAWLELFAARGPIGEDHRVYYWYTTADRGWVVILPIAVETHHSTGEELWVLVDEATGLVLDAVHRDGG